VNSAVLSEADNFEAKFNEFMENDFNSAGAIGAMFQYISIFNSLFAAEMSEKSVSAAYVYSLFMKYIDLLAIADEDYILAENKTAAAEGLAEDLIKVLIKIRSELKGEKNYKMADYVRNEIKSLGVILEDTKEGTKFHIEKK
ncbi:MAG TPA: hypothetical protein PK467_04665, partial [Candidatus Wallbacteria bacterium]|nr:hypothetical protein [Candidatus Wallbacteria bacterium]